MGASTVGRHGGGGGGCEFYIGNVRGGRGKHNIGGNIWGR